ncbi:MAG: hypothetical protein IPK18_13045 [Sphingobacteriales bacterium]|nr:MAG: hypothetical protein IPK18_13045 [Sphingobacteriales bacterium]
MKIQIQTSNRFNTLNNKNKGILANTQKRMVDGNNVLESARSTNPSKDIVEYCI